MCTFLATSVATELIPLKKKNKFTAYLRTNSYYSIVLGGVVKTPLYLLFLRGNTTNVCEFICVCMCVGVKLMHRIVCAFFVCVLCVCVCVCVYWYSILAQVPTEFNPDSGNFHLFFFFPFFPSSSHQSNKL